MHLSTSSLNDDNRLGLSISKRSASEGRPQAFKSSPLISGSLSTVSTAANSSFSSIRHCSNSDLMMSEHDVESIVRRASSIVYSRHSLELVDFYDEEDVPKEEECDVSKRSSNNGSSSTNAPWYSNFQPCEEFSSRENDILSQLCGELQRLKEMSAINPNDIENAETVTTVERKRRLSQSIRQRTFIQMEQQAIQRDSNNNAPSADFADLLKAADHDPNQKELLQRLGHFVSTPRLKRLHDHENPYTDRVFQKIPDFVKEKDYYACPQFETVATVQKEDPDYVPVADYRPSGRFGLLQLWKKLRPPPSAA